MDDEEPITELDEKRPPNLETAEEMFEREAEESRDPFFATPERLLEDDTIVDLQENDFLSVDETEKRVENHESRYINPVTVAELLEDDTLVDLRKVDTVSVEEAINRVNTEGGYLLPDS